MEIERNGDMTSDSIPVDEASHPTPPRKDYEDDIDECQ